MNPVTPMRQIPGAFFNTPAPGAATGPRRRLFNEPPAAGQVAAMNAGGLAASQAGKDAAVTSGAAGVAPVAKDELPPIVRAARCINENLQQEESYPDLDSYCRPGASSEYDIQFPETAWAPFERGNVYPIPEQIFDRLNGGQVNTRLGLFASIGFAWASIDSSIFLWDYSIPNPDLIGYEDATHPITAVALVKPKPDVFVKTITHILVIATTSDIILLGLSATPTPSGSHTVALYQTKMSVHRGGSDVSFIRGSNTGRIFFGGESDTDIYELFYQQEERWFSSRCGKINHTSPGWAAVVPSLPLPPLPVPGFGGSKQTEYITGIWIDDSRKLLYSLSSKSTIRTYHMESPEKLTKVIEKDKVSCLRDIAHMIDGRSTLLNDRINIVSISPISSNEASKLHLMAVTNTGCRLFLSATSSASYVMNAATSLAPQSMQVQFVKFPPREPGRASRTVSSQTRETGLDIESRTLDSSVLGDRFAPGYFFDFVRRPDNPSEDMLFVSTPDTGRIKFTTPASALRYFEQGNWIQLDRGHVLEVGLTKKEFSAAKQPLGFGNELAVQFDEAPSEFAVLTSTGVHMIRRRRLVDILADAIRGAPGDEGLEREIRKFLNQYGRVETISAALAVACGQGSHLRTGTSRAPDHAAEDGARRAFVNFGGQPRLAETDSNQFATVPVQLSSRHDALALYLTRLVRLLWKTNVVTIKPEKTGITVTSTVPTSRLITVQENIERLRNFLEANKGTIQGLTGPAERIGNRHEEIALQKEHQALHSLRKLMENISEGISFVLMLFDERVADIYTRLDESARVAVKALTYESLFSTQPGKELAKILVKAIVNRNIANGANVETVADALRRRCGSFCSPDDVVIFKAQEQLQRGAEQVQNPGALRTLLGESLRLFEQVAGSLTSANLGNAIDQYIALKYYAGAIQLCLRVAREKDRGNTALGWVNEGKPANDDREKAFRAREECYVLIHDVLDALETASALEPETLDGRPTLAATKRREAYAVVNNSDDEVFHFNLYDWYLQKNWTDRLLSIDSPHVVTFLQRLASTKAGHADLLCRFYTHRGRYFEAAKVQADLAKSELAIGIKDRISLLSRAKGNASVDTIGVSRQDQQILNHEVTELLEIAHIQDDLLERLRADDRIPDERLPDITQALDGPIQGLSELFNNYADQAGYYDLCLLIYNAADYQNPRTIADTWTNLITQTHHENEERQDIWRLYQARQLPAGVPLPEAKPPLPYESVSTAIQNIAHRTSLDSLIFPVDALVPMVCQYAINQGQDASIGADPCWPVLLFLHLGVPHALIVHVLEHIFETQEAPFTGRRRKLVVQWLYAAIEEWVREVERRGKAGDSTVGASISELLGRADDCLAQLATATRNNQGELDELQATRRAVRTLRRTVDALLGPGQQGSIFR